MIENRIFESTEKALDFLTKRQDKDPLFAYQTVFPAILVLESIRKISTPKAEAVKSRLARKMVSQVSEYGSFNYWRRDSEQYLKEPYPDDLDDTCLAWAALRNYKEAHPSNKMLAKIMDLLTGNEEILGGPYQTWCVPKDLKNKWDDVDLAVNSNIAYLLSLFEVRLDNLNKLVEGRIQKNRLQSKYYGDLLIIIYFISRFYQGKKKELLKNILLNELDYQKLTAQKLSLAISSLINLGYSQEVRIEWIEKIIDWQNNDGDWNKEDFYYYQNSEGSFVGFAEVTTGLAIECLDAYWNSLKVKEKTGNELRSVLLKSGLAYFPPKDAASIEIRKIIKKTIERNEFAYITPYLVFDSLGDKQKKLIDDKTLFCACLVNLFGWCAYSIIDRVIDEKKNTDKLPLALMLIHSIYKVIDDMKIGKKRSFKKLYYQLFSKMESANYWELKKGRLSIFNEKHYPDEVCANKSLPHVLGPLIILWKINAPKDDLENFLNYYQKLLTSKQMIDDFEDCFKDWKKKKINSVNYVLTKYQQKKDMEVLFWKHDALRVCRQIETVLLKAEASLQKIKIITNKSKLVSLIEKYWNIVKYIKKSRKNTLVFLSEYYS